MSRRPGCQDVHPGRLRRYGTVARSTSCPHRMAMAHAPRVNWRLAFGLVAVLVLVFTIQNWAFLLGTPGQVTFPTALERQAIIWLCWLALTPLIIAAAR